MKRLLLLITLLTPACYNANFVTSQGVAVFIECEEWEWPDKEINASAWGIVHTHPHQEMFETAFEFFATEGPRILGVTERDIRWVLRYSELYLKCERFQCGKWSNVAGCNWYDGRHAAVWFGDVWCSAVFHEFMHNFIEGHLVKGQDGYGDRDKDPWWAMEDELNELYRVRHGNLSEDAPPSALHLMQQFRINGY